jgi:hypothetical protein
MREDHAAGCDAFWLWALPGALLSFAFVTGFSIGILVLPFGWFKDWLLAGGVCLAVAVAAFTAARRL